MYYEKLKIRKYTNKGSPYYQIRLLKDSKFKEVSEVALINVSEIKEINEKIKALENNETEKKYKELKNKHNDLIKAYNDLKEENKELVTESLELKETIINNTPKLELKTKEINELNNKIQALTEDTYKEIQDLNFKLNNEKDFSKALLIAISDLKSRGLIGRIKNNNPESYKVVMKLKELPENIISEDPEENIKE